MAKKPKKSRYASEAAAQSLVRFGPQLEALQELQQQAVENRAQSIAQAKGGAAGTIAEIDRTLPQMRALYDQAGKDAAQRASILGPDLAGLGSVANSIRGAAQVEQGQGARMLGQSAVNSLGGLLEKRVGTKEGEKFQTQNAQSQFVSDLTKLMTRRQNLAGQEGAFQATTIGDLTREDRKARADARKAAATLAREDARIGLTASGQAETRRHNRVSESSAAAGKLPGGAKLATPVQHGGFKDEVERLRSIVRQEKAEGTRRGELARDLLRGVPSSTVVDPKTKQKLKDPGLPKVSNQLALSTALDLEYNRFLSGKNLSEIRKRRYSLKQLGYPAEARLKAERAKRVPGVKLPGSPWASRAKG